MWASVKIAFPSSSKNIIVYILTNLSSRARTRRNAVMTSLMLGFRAISLSGTWRFVHALLPTDLSLTIYLFLCQDAIEIHHPGTGQNTRYETIFPKKSLPYSKAVCDKLQTPWISENDSEDDIKDDSDGGAMPAEQVTSIDNDDEWEDTVEHLSTGIRDVLVTGKVSNVSDFCSRPVTLSVDEVLIHFSYADEPTTR
jgi:hypothetical protein